MAVTSSLYHIAIGSSEFSFDFICGGEKKSSMIFSSNMIRFGELDTPASVNNSQPNQLL